MEGETPFADAAAADPHELGVGVDLERLANEQ